tara:strand:+ start:3367 stop:3609 length:243 start_codon:yes stop_codon:yes gene_type:complete
MEKSECLTYPFPPGSEIWHMIESTSQDCYTMDGCGECDTCYWCDERAALKEANPQLYESIWTLFHAYQHTKKILRAMDIG